MSDRAIGLLVLDKPEGPTSHDVVQEARKAARVRRIGHTGTLDPAASGVLVLCLGKATRLVEYLTGHDKRYRAVVAFGTATDTHDAAGEVTATSDVRPDRAALEAALARFRGTILQRPPAWSALRSGGRRAHELARAGVEVDLPPREVTIHELALLDFDGDRATVDVACSAGTYIRSIARDLGEAVGGAAHLAALRRTRSGAFDLADAAPPEALFHGGWRDLLRPVGDGLPDWAAVTADPALALDLAQGRIPAGDRVVPDSRPEDRPPRVRAHTADGALVAMLEHRPEDDTYRPRKVFVTPEDLARGARGGDP